MPVSPCATAKRSEEDQVTVVRGRATRLDAASRTLHVDGQAALSYDALILATGAEPVRLTVPGAELTHVHYLRTLRDSRTIANAAEGAKNAVVIGASFIGLEVAASIRTRNAKCAVHVVAPEALPLERGMGSDLGQFIESVQEEH